MKNEISRKEFLEKLPLLGIAFAGGWLLLHSCSKSETDEDPCADLSKLTAEEKQTREDFEYVSKSPFPDKLCDNCELWLNPEEGKFCGGCEIMEGPIHPKGYCNAWVEVSQ
jgi:hypothetical protein